MLLTEIIGLQTLIEWIETNEFKLNQNIKYDELGRTEEKLQEIISFGEKNKQLSFKAVRPYLGTAETMQ